MPCLVRLSLIFFLNGRLCHFISDLMDYFLAGNDQQQTNQPNDPAGGWPLSCNLPCLPLGHCCVRSRVTNKIVSRFTTGTQQYRQSDWSFFFLPSCSEDFPETNQWFLSFYLRAYGCFLYGWCSPATCTVKAAEGQTCNPCKIHKIHTLRWTPQKQDKIKMVMGMRHGRWSVL